MNGQPFLISCGRYLTSSAARSENVEDRIGTKLTGIAWRKMERQIFTFAQDMAGQRAPRDATQGRMGQDLPAAKLVVASRPPHSK